MYKNIMNYVCEMVEDFEVIEIVENFECLAYNINDSKLYVPESIEEDEEFDNFMISYLKEWFDLELSKEELKIFYVLHEIGHHETRDLVDYDAYMDEVETIDNRDFLRYRLITAERYADMWATQFIEAFGIENILK